MAVLTGKHETIGSIYWVISHLCNQECGHCYMSCSPQGSRLSVGEIDAIVKNLPERINFNIILSGGELLHPSNKELLFHAADRLLSKYGRRQIAIQTNGDFLTDVSARECLKSGITHISVSSIDGFHTLGKFKTQKDKIDYARKTLKTAGYKEFSMVELTHEKVFLRAMLMKALFSVMPGMKASPNFTVWGANEDIWLRGNWARGRALAEGNVLYDCRHNFCHIWSGGRAFLNAGMPNQEIVMQLKYLYPCCPTTRVVLGDITQERVSSALARAENHKIFRAINRGKPYLGTEELGMTTEKARSLYKEKGNICLLCDSIIKSLPREDYPLSPFDVYSDDRNAEATEESEP